VGHEGGLLLEAEDCPRNLVRLHDGVSRRHPHEKAAKVFVKAIDLGKANWKRWDSPCQVRHFRRDLPRRPHDAAGQGDVRLKSRRCTFPAQIEDCSCQAVTNIPGGHQPNRVIRCFLVWAHIDLSGSLISWASIGVVCVQERNSRRWTLPRGFGSFSGWKSSRCEILKDIAIVSFPSVRIEPHLKPLTCAFPRAESSFPCTL